VAEKIKNEVAKQKLTISVLGPVTGLREKGLFTQEIILKIKNAASAEATAGQRKERSNLLRLVGSQWRVSLD